MFTRLVHSAPARVIRVLAGFLLVVAAAYQSIAAAFALALLGTIVAVTAIADVCLLEQAGLLSAHPGSGPPRPGDAASRSSSSGASASV